MICKHRLVEVLNLPCSHQTFCIECHKSISEDINDIEIRCHECRLAVQRFNYKGKVFHQNKFMLALKCGFFLFKNDYVTKRSKEEMIAIVDEEFWDFYEYCPIYNKIQLKEFIRWNYDLIRYWHNQ